MDVKAYHQMATNLSLAYVIKKTNRDWAIFSAGDCFYISGSFAHWSLNENENILGYLLPYIIICHKPTFCFSTVFASF